MTILLVGFLVAAVSYFLKPVGLILTIVSLLPLLIAFVGGPIQVMIDPASVGTATNGIMTALANYIKDWAFNYPGAVLFGALIGTLT